MLVKLSMRFGTVTITRDFVQVTFYIRVSKSRSVPMSVCLCVSGCDEGDKAIIQKFEGGGAGELF
jgi:hypothetical protein